MKTCEDLRDSFELYSLGLLDDSEDVLQIEAHLARGCEACTAHMKEAFAVKALMMSHAPEVVPPTRLKRRVMSAVGVQPMGWTWFATAAAAAMLMLALWFNFESRTRQAELAQAQRTLNETVAERDRLDQAFRFLEQPETRQVNFGSGQTNPPRGNVYIHSKLGVLLIAQNLPELPAGKVYEMWLVPKNGNPKPAGLFQSTASGTAVHTLSQLVDVSDIAAVAVTVEPAVGSTTPTMPLVIAAPIA
jgi:anti-sigma-K factor RskA